MSTKPKLVEAGAPVPVVQERSMWGDLDYADQTMLQTIKDTVAKGATDAEFRLFVEVCKSTRLNPFKKEVWLIPGGANRAAQIMTGVNGFLAIANSQSQFDGMETSVEREGGKIVSATCKVYRKDRRVPHVVTVYMAEFAKGGPTWSTMPAVMLQKVAKSHALREAFPQVLGGLYTDDEMPREYSEPTSRVVDITPPKAAAKKGETEKQAHTRALIDAGDSWVYDSEQIEVPDTERKALWAKLVASYGAVRDQDGCIHTSQQAMEIATALIHEPGRGPIPTEEGAE